MESMFNPNEHLMKIGKADYLPVQWRLVWFRENHPNGIIETEMVHFDPDRECECEVTEWVDNPNNVGKKMPVKKSKKAYGMAIFRATISDGNGGKAAGTKSENAASFDDYIEKAETGAIGRALAALGFGTQFTGDEFNEKHRIVDAPVKNDDESTTATSASGKPAQTAKTEVEQASDEQWNKIRVLCEQVGQPVPSVKLTVQQASNVIARLEKQAATATKTAKPAEQNGNRATPKLQALGKIEDRCKEEFGAEKGAIAYRNLRANAVKVLQLGDVPDELMPDEALAQMWKDLRNAIAKQPVGAGTGK